MRLPLFFCPRSLLVKPNGFEINAFFLCHSARLSVVSLLLTISLSSARAVFSSSFAALYWHFRDRRSRLSWLICTSRRFDHAGIVVPRFSEMPNRSAPMPIMRVHIVWSFCSTFPLHVVSRILSRSSLNWCQSFLLAAGHFTRHCSGFLP